MSCLFKRESLEVIGFVRRFCLEASFMKPEEVPLMVLLGLALFLGIESSISLMLWGSFLGKKT